MKTRRTMGAVIGLGAVALLMMGCAHERDRYFDDGRYSYDRPQIGHPFPGRGLANWEDWDPFWYRDDLHRDYTVP